jgi:hypothetical protein
MEEGTVVGAGSTEEAVVADFMEVAEEGFTVAEVSRAEGILVSAADIRLVDIVAADIGAADIGAAASTVAAATTAVTAAMDGEAGATAGVVEVGAMEDMGTEEAGAGDLASGGRIGDMAGDIRMATTVTAHGITRLTPIILSRPTGLRTT